GIALEAMYQNLKTTVCGNKVRSFQTVFNDNDHCNVVNNWITTNGFSSAPFDSGAAQIIYYEGFGMPTVAVAAGNTHQLLYLCKQGFPVNDTSIIATAIRNYCTTSADITENDFQNSIVVSPNPTEGKFKVQSLKFKVQDFEIYNAVGEKVNAPLSPCPLSFEIDLSSYHNGIYFLKINAAQGVIQRKIVVTK
ncbi:MAG: T9SS type A sorting domain-containing protein, partial [Candidatus Diapherotrites archaeon]|nr:T9SS type A sorting domain-containing protein [Candidatus Diapherotrites archaeon]